MKTTLRQDPLLPLSSDQELEVPTNPFEKSPILNSKNVDFADFTIKAHAFHIDEYFENICSMSVATLEENAYL